MGFPFLAAKRLASIECIAQKLTTPVSVVVPVFNHPKELQRCVESILFHTRIPFDLILIDDCSPDPAIEAVLEKYRACDAVRVLCNARNEGFVRSANAGIRATSHDVVLLNSDTEVTPRWLQKLTVAAYSDSKVATVTPFSNAAGAFSVPEIGINAPIPFPFTVLKMARLIERLSDYVYPQVPTGNGFCMYIKRQTLDEIGEFDEENFGRGYGEENDFCMRALKAGWRHIIDDSLFIYHRGNSSFGQEKQTLLHRHRETLNRLYPEYTGLVDEFISSPSINALRSRIGDRLKNGAPDLCLDKARLLLLLDQDSGAAPMTNADLLSRFSDTHQCFLLASNGTEMTLSAWEGDQSVEKQRWQIPGSPSAKNHGNVAADQICFQILTTLGIDLVHIRDPFKHSFDAPLLCRQLGIPVVLDGGGS